MEKEKNIDEENDPIRAQNLILVFTLIAAICIGVEQNSINEGIRDADIKPIILRDGFLINDWDDLKIRVLGMRKEPALQFKVAENIALDVRGYVIIDKVKYLLFFDIAPPSDDSIHYDCPPLNTNNLVYKLNWVDSERMICADLDVIKTDTRKFIDSENEIYLEYKDVLGGKHFTRENYKFEQTVGKLK